MAPPVRRYAFGIAGLWLFVRGRIVPATACLTAYSVSGLVLAFAPWSVAALRPATRPAA